jgi:hypothetical protein
MAIKAVFWKAGEPVEITRPTHEERDDIGCRHARNECTWEDQAKLLFDLHEAEAERDEFRRLYHQAAEAVQRKYHGHEPLEDVLRRAHAYDALRGELEEERNKVHRYRHIIHEAFPVDGELYEHLKRKYGEGEATKLITTGKP